MFFASRQRLFRTQPQFGAPISQRALNRGVQWIFLGSGMFWSRATGWVVPTRNGSPKQYATVRGRAMGFGSQGTANSDRMDGPAFQLTNNWLSYYALATAIDAGGGSLGRLFQPVTGTGSTGVGAWHSSSYKMTFTRETTGGQTQWGISGTPTFGSPQGFGVTLDQRSAGTSPALYENGGAVSTGTLTSPGGGYVTGSVPLTVGNRASDGARYWNGTIALEVLFDDPVSGLSAAEHLELHTEPYHFLFEQPARFFFAPAGGASSATVSGQILTATASLIPGSASGSGTSASVSGQTLTATASLIAGSASGVINGVLSFTLKNNTGTPLASLTGVVVNIYNPSTGALVLRATGQTTNGSGVCTVISSSITPGTSYAFEPDLSSSSLGRRLPVQAAA